MKNLLSEKIHLCLDGYNADIQALRNEELLSIYFRAVKKSAFTQILYYPDDTGRGKEGVNGYLLGAGFHTTVRTYTNRQNQCYFLDIFGFEEKKHRNALTYLDGSYESTFISQYTLSRRTTLDSLPPQYTLDTKVYSPHLMVQLQIERSPIPFMRKNIKELLSVLPTEIGVLSESHIFQIESKEWFSTLRVTAEAHIAAHYHITSQTIYLDIFSCSPMDSTKLLYLIKEKFLYKSLSHRIIERGLQCRQSQTQRNQNFNFSALAI